jgi:mitochondrial splicing suppressor protein 51
VNIVFYSSLFSCLHSLSLLYHEYASQHSYVPPSLVVAFNSGLHEATRQWSPTVKLLVEKKLPCVFTSYNSGEARDDARHLENMGVKFIWREERNTWSGQKAHFDYFTEDLFWYENAFTLGFRGSS